MPAPTRAKRRAARSSKRPRVSDVALLELIQRQTFRYFWEGAHPVSGLAFDRRPRRGGDDDAPIATGASGFGVMAMLVACERGWVRRSQALVRLTRMLDCLERATCYHGMYPHFMRGDTGATIPFSRKDDGADLVESSYLFQGLLCARAYFTGEDGTETRLRDRITNLWQEAEWNWFVQQGQSALTWHWSATNGFALNHPIHGWNECLITYLLAVCAPRYAVPASLYHSGWAHGPHFRNGRSFEGVELPLGPDWGGPLFFAHLSFCGIDPRGLRDRYADYWQQNVSHTRINYEHCVRNPNHYRGYGPDCWGLTAGDSPRGYEAHAPDQDSGVITPAAALASFPYAPEQAMAAARYFYEELGERIWSRFGFVDGFSEADEWYASDFIGISQGPIVVMMENFRSGLLWKLFMGIPEIQTGLQALGFTRSEAA
jgi:hypothetical protein